MTSPTPDISQLSISSPPQQRDYDAYNDQHKNYHYNTSPPNNNSNSGNAQPSFQYPQAASLGAQSAKKQTRAGLPSQWYDNQTGQDGRALSPPHTSDLSSGTGSPPHAPHISQSQLYGGAPATTPTSNNGPSEDDIIPNAIVIKNIPFNVKRETLLDIIASLSIPTPYAFNYHIDPQGQFRGLAFANFRLASDADAVVAALNGFDVQGRKLRVEYKKVLLAGEKERIEREKALRRMRSMQMDKEREAYHRQQAAAVAVPAAQEWDEFGPVHSMPINSMPQPQTSTLNSLGTQASGGGMSPPGLLGSGMPIPSPARSHSNVGLGLPQQQMMGLPSLGNLHTQPPAQYPSPPPVSQSSSLKGRDELDLNDPSTLDIYSRILVFKEDRMRDELAFSRTLTPKQRRIVHLVAQRLGVYHYSVGEGEDRYAVVTRFEKDSVPRINRQVSTSYLNANTGSMQSGATNALSNAGGRHTIGGPGLRVKKSMPNLASVHEAPSSSSLQAPPSRLTTRSSNGNIREGYNTISSPSPRRSRNDAFGALFGTTSTNSSAAGAALPPVPNLPSLIAINGEGASGILRQPRGPGTGGFGTRRPTGESNPAGGPLHGLDTRSHEPLEI